MQILEIPTGQSRARWATSIRRAIRTTGWIPTTAGGSPRRSQDKLGACSADDAAYFAQRYADFDSRLDEAEKRWTAAMAPYKGTKIVTYHRSWPNFAERFGLDVIGYVEPKPGIPPSPSHTLELINEMKRQNVKLILVEPYFDLKTPNVDRPRDRRAGAGAAAVGRRREGSDRLHQAVRLRHQPAGRGVQADGSE